MVVKEDTKKLPKNREILLSSCIHLIKGKLHPNEEKEAEENVLSRFFNKIIQLKSG